jgi:hypothetical protein
MPLMVRGDAEIADVSCARDDGPGAATDTIRIMETVRVSIRDGEVHDAGSWLYIWVPTGRAEVLYVGGTGLPPALRTWLHLHHEDPAIARVAQRYPAAATKSLEIIAFRLPETVDRPSAKAELIRQLHDQELLAPEYVGDPLSRVDVPDQVRSLVRTMVSHLKGTVVA